MAFVDLVDKTTSHVFKMFFSLLFLAYFILGLVWVEDGSAWARKQM